VFGKTQALYLAAALITLAVLYFGFDRRPPETQALETSRAISGATYDIATLEREAGTTLTAMARVAATDSARNEALKQLSALWYSARQPVLAGLYARQVAESENAAASWSITGTTFALALTGTETDDAKRAFARDQAIDAFEKAISLEPAVVEHRINQALCYVEAPPADQPMKGIQMLTGLATTYPESAGPPFQLARLAVRTGQYDRARTRIEQALALAPDDPRIACLAIDIYTALNLPEQARALAEKCAEKE
jgi:tetratricopeptide (TPR) repeat protein